MSTWRMSAWAFAADFILVPVYIGVAVMLSLRYAEPATDWIALFALGFVAWTLIEYVMHRAIFHRVFRREHWIHHVRPTEWIGVSPVFTSAGLIGIWLMLTHLLDGAGRGGMAFVGFAVGYYAYIVVHLFIHHTTWALGGWRAAHEMHHKTGVEANFGVLTDFWDRMFGTYHEPGAR